MQAEEWWLPDDGVKFDSNEGRIREARGGLCSDGFAAPHRHMVVSGLTDVLGSAVRGPGSQEVS